jgi:pimeloyl-ACP methyl ester carboxylesterase
MQWLMLRGLAREKRHWGSFPTMFGDALACGTHTIDLPGFGTESERPSPTSIAAITDDTRARFLRERAPGAWSILAISLGGMVALDWCARYPADFARCVVINTSAADLSLPHERFLAKNWPTVARTALGGDAVQRERNSLAMTVNRADLDKEAIAVRWAEWARERRPTQGSFVRQLYAATTSRLPKKIDVPVQVLAAKTDRLVSVKCSEKIAAKLRVPLSLHDGGGHDLSLDAPEWIIEQVRRGA